MSRQIDIVGYLYIAYGALVLIAAFIVSIAIFGGGLLSGDAGVVAITSGIGIAVGLLLLLLAAPSIIGGYGLLKRYEWGRVLVIVLSVLNLLNFPIGTILGGYALWVLFQEEARVEF